MDKTAYNGFSFEKKELEELIKQAVLHSRERVLIATLNEGLFKIALKVNHYISDCASKDLLVDFEILQDLPMQNERFQKNYEKPHSFYREYGVLTDYDDDEINAECISDLVLKIISSFVSTFKLKCDLVKPDLSASLDR